MRYRTCVLLSDYVLGRASLEELRAAVEDVDWDDLTIPEHERAILLNVEARLVGIDEGLNDESDISSLLMGSMAILNSISWADVPDPNIVLAQSNKEVQTSLMHIFPSPQTVIYLQSPDPVLPR